MAKPKRRFNFDSNQHDEGNWADVSIFCESVFNILNRGLNFTDNFKANIAAVTFSAINTDVNVSHNLGIIPSGFISIYPSAAMDVYVGTLSWTENSITVKSSVAGNTKLLIF